MPLTTTAALVRDARSAGRAVGAFNVTTLETAEAILIGAEAADLPVILQISENCVHYHGGLAPIASATIDAAWSAGQPASVHLDHAVTPELVDEAIQLGIGSVMFDASHLDYDDNLERTADVAERCHDAGIWVEAELGAIGGKEGAHAPGVRTDPDEADRFIAATGVDALAVAVGSTHARTTRDTALDHDLIARLREAVPVPLVLHGSSGVSDSGLAAAVRAGITKVNLSTHLNKVFTGAVRRHLDENPDVVDTRKYLGAGRDAMAAEVAALLRLLALED